MLDRAGDLMARPTEVRAMRLPADRRNHTRARIEAALEELDIAHLDQDIGRLYWTVRPTIYEAFETLTHAQPQKSTFRNVGLQLIGAGSGMKYRLQADALMGAFTRNEARVLRSIADARRDTSGNLKRVAPPAMTPPNMRDLDVGLARFSSYLIEMRRLCGSDEIKPLVALVRKAVRASISYYESRTIIERYSPRVVVVANQHSPGPRGLLMAAIDLKVPTVYFPHAPLSSHPCYRDLPVTSAGLRGPREVDFYLKQGADSRRLSSVGDPTISRRSSSLAPTGPPILALSPLPTDELSAMVRVVRSATSGAITVCPHPSSDLETLRVIVPDDWKISSRRTFDEMQSGASLVIQRSSGVALEALSLGIPVVELQFAESSPGYTFLQEPYVWFVQRDNELREVIERVSSLPAATRQGMVTWAEDWIGPQGATAAYRARDLLENISRSGSPDGELVLDRIGANMLIPCGRLRR